MSAVMSPQRRLMAAGLAVVAAAAGMAAALAAQLLVAAAAALDMFTHHPLHPTILPAVCSTAPTI